MALCQADLYNYMYPRTGPAAQGGLLNWALAESAVPGGP